MGFHWDFGAVWQYKDMLLVGLLGTFKLAITAVTIGVLVGLFMCVLRMSKKKYFSIPAVCFIEFYRNTPPIVHFFWFFYALPILAGVSLSAYWAAAIALSTQSGAFYAEVFRGGIKSIERGQWEGAKSLGMSYTQAMKRIIIPQSMKRMIGPFIERTFELTKTTTLASTLAYSDLVYQAMQVNSITFRPLEVYTTIALMFFASLLLLSTLMKYVEHKFMTIRATTI